jgi:hypothetical protein
LPKTESKVLAHQGAGSCWKGIEGHEIFNFDSFLPPPQLISCRKMPKTENPYGMT